MASHRGHISKGLLFGGILLLGLSYSSAATVMPWPEKLAKGVVMLWLAVLFALFPDVDIKSKGQLLYYRLFFALDGILILLRQYEVAAVLGLVAVIPILSRHRGWTHTYWAMFLVPLPVLVGPAILAREPILSGLPYYLGALAGYFSHLVADGMIFRRPKRSRA